MCPPKLVDQLSESQMLSMMGWEEGGGIGTVGVSEPPVQLPPVAVAVIRVTFFFFDSELSSK